MTNLTPEDLGDRFFKKIFQAFVYGCVIGLTAKIFGLAVLVIKSCK